MQDPIEIRRSIDDVLSELEQRNREACEKLRHLMGLRVDPQVAKERYYNEIRVAYETEPARALRFYFPIQPMTLKMVENVVFSRYKDLRGEFQRMREEWMVLVGVALEKARDVGLFDRWEALNEAVTVITIYDTDDRMRDVDNFEIVAIHNALRRQRIIEEDNFNSLRYVIQRCVVQGVYVPYSEFATRGTGIAVLDAEGSDIIFHNWKLKELAEWPGSDFGVLSRT